ncbi:MAG: response regulator transcription factor [Phycisphaeraceae bacterium]|nr:response regulator transcription factor [Phycisphaeraceae bacterium]
MSLGTVLVIEDDPAIRRGVCDALACSGYSVREAADGRAGLEAALAGELDLVLLDILMPKMNGTEVLRELRRSRASLPVIFLTAVGEEEDRVQGLRLGADDYVIKPFGVNELLARIEAVMRRSPGRPAAQPRIVIAGRTIDFDRREAVLEDGTRASLTPREAELLAYLAANRGRAVSREELLQRVWGLDPRGMQTRTIDMAVARIREVLKDDPSEPRVITTVRAKGYMLAGDASDPVPTADAHREGG